MAGPADELLQRFAPRLVYDSQENYFADSPAVMAESEDVELRRADGTVIATAPGLEFLGPETYANGEPVLRNDRFAITTRDYLNASRRVRESHANRMYARGVEDPDGALWLQYWFFYFYDDTRVESHDGDWEMIQLRLAGDDPELAVYAQGRGGQARPWAEVERVGERPLIYVARGSHASYFEPGRHWTGTWFDRADGGGPAIDPALDVVGDELPGWVVWPGTWGASRGSPSGPAAHAQWRDPSRLVSAAERRPPAKAPDQEVPVPEAKLLGDRTLEYVVPPDAGVAALAVTVRVPGQQDGAATYTFPIDVPKGAIELPEALQQGYELVVSAISEAGDAGDATTLGTGAPAPEPEAPEPPPLVRDTLAGFVADTAEGPDRLDIMADVRSLATVIAAQSVEPPLSIGLFGEWGSGKSFFMGKLREHVDRLQTETRAAGGESAYCSHIRQIVFNAWHYADANLWASLVTHIFESLAGPGDDRERLAALLKTTEVQRDRAAERLEAAVAERDAAQEELEEAQGARARHRARGVKLSRGDVARLVADSDIQSTADRLAQGLGRDTLEVGEIGDVSRRLSHTVTRVPYVWRLLKRQPWWAALAALVIVALVIVAVFAKSVIAAVAVVVPLVTLLAGPFRALARLAEEAERASAQVDASLGEAEEAARKRRDAADVEGVAAAEELNDIESGQALFRFVEERARSSDYREYLGLIALIRRDFEALTTQLAAGEGVAIDRVVLYIDDLDRCSIERVVEVLEAVHLLLAFSLFVVVVSVDPRWLVQSLKHRYPQQLGSVDATQTPQDYLEKIFQIPFSLEPMDADGFKRLVSGMFPPPPDQPADDRHAPAEGGTEAQAPELKALDRSLTGVTTAPEEPVDLQPESLLITRHELAFLRHLAPLIETPREAKRLANTYRLIRATLTGDALKAFTDEAGGGFRAVLVLLAVLIGERDLADGFFAQVASFDGERWPDFVAQLPAGETLTKRLAGVAVPDPFEPFRTWLPRVSRYSFTSPTAPGPRRSRSTAGRAP